MSDPFSLFSLSTAQNLAVMAERAPNDEPAFVRRVRSPITDAARAFENVQPSQRLPRSVPTLAATPKPIANALLEGDDPLYRFQWHLNNEGQFAFASHLPTPDVDLNIGNLHRDGINGAGVEVGIRELEPVDARHEDLAANMVVRGKPKQGSVPKMTTGHATAVAGLIAAVAGNGKGGRGVAPGAKIVDLLRPEAKNLPRPRLINQCWGRATDKFKSYRKSKVFKDGGEQAQLVMKSAGNKFEGDARQQQASIGIYPDITQESGAGWRSANNDPQNSRWNVVAVGAVNAAGRKASYSQTGSSLWVSGLGGERGWESVGGPPSPMYAPDPAVYAPALLTTDLTGCRSGMHKYEKHAAETSMAYNLLEGRGRDKLDPQCSYTARFNGTSAAAPTVTGVAAMMLQVNPDLSWRDIKYLLAVTARKVDAEHKPIKWQGVTFEDGWVTNAAGRFFNNWYGFGLVDAERAVTAARTFRGLPPAVDAGWLVSSGQPVSIPYREEDDGYSAIQFDKNMRVEAVQIRLRTTHPDPHNLRIALISPSGTRSIILPPLTDTVADWNKAFTINRVATNAFLDENAKGEWKLQVIDVLNPDSSRYALESWEIRVLGHDAVANV